MTLGDPADSIPLTEKCKRLVPLHEGRCIIGKSAPKAPDPAKTAAAQTGTNVATAVANAALGNVNQITPDGTLTYNQSGTKSIYDPTSKVNYDVPIYTATQTLSPAQQAIKAQEDAAQLNLGKLANNQSARLDGLLGTPFSLNGLPAGGNAANIKAPQYQQFANGPQLQTSLGNAGDITKSYGTDYAANGQQIQDTLMQRLQPMISQDDAAMEQKLANQGILRGSAAFDAAMDERARATNDARMTTVLAGGQEQSRLANLARDQALFQNTAQQQGFDQNLSSATFGNTGKQQMFTNQNTVTGQNNQLQDQKTNAQLAQFNAANQQRQQALSEKFAERNQPINEVSSLLSGSQVTNPQWASSNMPTLPTVDYAGLVQQKYQNDMGAYQQSNGLLNNIGSGIGSILGLGSGSIGGKLFGLSDERAKKDVKKVGKTAGKNGHDLYAYRYIDEPQDAPIRIGLLAQKVEKKQPGAVKKTRSGLLAVDYGKALGGK
ncbi:tail fiber domain-containing protein [Phyllobacterium sp. SB3]|uniref:tail fiber domain-containing protein n=1 Tax=Phyllobacterium sp. SB3 TaxID=3156073 RepID=UPI0032AF4A68